MAKILTESGVCRLEMLLNEFGKNRRKTCGNAYAAKKKIRIP